jgi:hypothetical protein
VRSHARQGCAGTRHLSTVLTRNEHIGRRS